MGAAALERLAGGRFVAFVMMIPSLVIPAV